MPNRTDHEFPPHLSVVQAAAFLGVSPVTVRKLIRLRTLPHYRVRDRVILARDDLQAYLHAQRVPSRTEVPHASGDLPSGSG